MVQGELREQEPRFHCVARLPRGPMVTQPGLLCAGRALAPPSPVLGSPYPSSQKSGHFLCHVSPRWLQRTPKHPHICSHVHAHSLKAQSILTHTLHPHSPLHTHWGAGASHEAQEPHTFFHHSPPHPLPSPEGYVGFGRVEGGTQASSLATSFTTSGTGCPGHWVPTAGLSVLHSQTSIFPS